MLDTADLGITKEVVPGYDVVVAGETAGWRISVTNNGPSTAENVVVTDPLPEGLVDGSVFGDVIGLNCTLGTPGDPADPMVCNLGTIAVGDTVTFDVYADVDPAYYADQPPTTNAYFIDNDAWVGSDIYDPNNSNNRDNAWPEIVERANLSLEKSAQPPIPWIAGESRTYRYNITNAGPSVARDVRLRDFLPSEVEVESTFLILEGEPGGTPLACNTSGGNVLICPLGDIAPTEAPGPVAVLVNVRILPEVYGNTDITNDADLITETPDPGGASDSCDGHGSGRCRRGGHQDRLRCVAGGGRGPDVHDRGGRTTARRSRRTWRCATAADRRDGAVRIRRQL